VAARQSAKRRNSFAHGGNHIVRSIASASSAGHFPRLHHPTGKPLQARNKDSSVLVYVILTELQRELALGPEKLKL
jgi:hypothetical protein